MNKPSIPRKPQSKFSGVAKASLHEPKHTPSASQDTATLPPILPVKPVVPDSLDAFSPVQSAASRVNPKRRKKVIIGVVVGALVLVAGAFAASKLLAPAAEPEQTVSVSEGTFQDVVEGKGTLEPVQTFIASAEVEGIVEEVSVGEGSVVAEGDVLYTVKNDDLDAAVVQAEAGLQGARDTLTQAQNKLNVARSTPAVNPTQDAEGNTVLVDTQATQISDAKSQVNAAQSALNAAQSAYDAAVAKAEKRTVRARMGGTVLGSNITAGTSLASLTTSNKPPLQISDMSKLIVKIPVSEVDIAKVQVGQVSKITFDALANLSLQGTVTHIAQTNTESTGSASAGSSSTAVRYEVTLQIDEPDSRLKSGMTAHASIITTSVENTLMVSNIALVTEGDKTFVYKKPLKDAKSGTDAAKGSSDEEQVEVKVEAANSSQSAISVVSGQLSAGDELLVSLAADGSADMAAGSSDDAAAEEGMGSVSAGAVMM